MSTARDLHREAEEAREKRQDLMESLRLAEEAVVAYGKDEDWGGMAEALCTRVNAWKHLYQKEENEALLMLGIKDAESAIEIAGRSEEPGDVALPYLYLAKILEEGAMFMEASEAYAEAVKAMEGFQPQPHYRREVVLDMMNHWYTCGFRADGEMSWVERAEEVLRELEAMQDINVYEQDTWVSGGYMRLARCVKDGDKEKAREYLEKAKGVIDGNGELVLRREQWERLACLVSLASRGETG